MSNLPQEDSMRPKRLLWVTGSLIPVTYLAFVLSTQADSQVQLTTNAPMK